MTDPVRLVLSIIAMGAAGAALMDVWSFALRRIWKVPTLDYAMLGRWAGHVARGRLVHERIAASAPVAGERAIGWVAHYSIGIAFAIPVVVLGGTGWLTHPTIAPAMSVALVTVLAPWLVMQPGMGLGFAASRSPRPGATRLRNLATHSVYGLGMYATAAVLAAL
ncbi:MAG TPA: DUF2938 domain-containing protein [Candidatus Limnocylindrales bacterium]|nr:DUF2938 domain-containing protein [Candidatus Limnocylindrales bacterium]